MTVAEAVEFVNEAISDLTVGPERVMAVDPEEVTVDWDARMSSGRHSKAFAVRTAVRVEVQRLLHQMPQVLLVAEDGMVCAIFGTDTGTRMG